MSIEEISTGPLAEDFGRQNVIKTLIVRHAKQILAQIVRPVHHSLQAFAYVVRTLEISVREVAKYDLYHFDYVEYIGYGQKGALLTASAFYNNISLRRNFVRAVFVDILYNELAALGDLLPEE